MKSFREYLAEELSDKLSHFTDFDGLLGILKSGYLKGGYYLINKVSLGKIKKHEKTIAYDDSEEREEVCLIRKSNKKEIEKIAEREADVEIVFDWDNVLNLRNVKKPYPIAEYPLSDKNGIIEAVNELIQKEAIPEKFKERVLDYFLFPKSNEDIERKIEKLKEKFPKLKEAKASVNELLWRSKRLKEYISGKRESEERIDVSKNRIPISSKYMKIIFLKTLDSEYKKENISEEQKKSLEYWIAHYYKQDPKLFEFRGEK